jgi:hypothetical protein
MNISKRSEMLDIELLKVLLPAPSDSMYGAKSELKLEDKRKKRDSYSASTIARHLSKLEKAGYIRREKNVALRKNGQQDRRGSQRCELTFKGLFKLVLCADLEDSEIELAVGKCFEYNMPSTGLTRLSLVKGMPVKAFRDSLKQMRSRINMEYFDEQYAITLFVENVIIDNAFDQFFKSLPKIKELKSKARRSRKMKNEAEKTLQQMPRIHLEMLLGLYDYMRDKREDLNKRMEPLSDAVRYLKSKGVKSLQFKNKLDDSMTTAKVAAT